MKEVNKEHFVSISAQGCACITNVFRNVLKSDSDIELHMASVKNNQWLLRTVSFEGSESVWVTRKHKRVEVRFPAVFGLQKSKIMITTVNDSTWWIRLATDEETQVFHRRRFEGNIHRDVLELSDEEMKVLKKTDPNYWVECKIFNDRATGSWMELKAVPAKKFRPYRTYRDTDTEILFWNDTVSREIYLPKAFRAMTGIQHTDKLPTRREGDIIIVEGRPGICCKCGRHISRYKQPIVNLCAECNNTNDISEELQECLKQLNKVMEELS